MVKVRVEVIPWLSETMGGKQQRLAWEEELAEGATVGELLHSLATRQPKFGKIAFASATGNFSEQVNVIYNGCVLQLPQEWETPLRDGDTVVLAPAFVGG